MVNIVPERWRDIAFRGEEQEASERSVAEVLPAHDAESVSSSNAQHRLGKLANRVRYERYVASLDQLPVEMTTQRGTSNPREEK